jgi:hypothetical protein
MNKHLEMMLKALASSAQADNGADTAQKERKVVTTSLFEVAKEAKTEKSFNQDVALLYQHLATQEGATWCQTHGVVLVASKRKDYPYKLPQSFLNAVSTLRGALKRNVLKATYAATKTAKAEAVKHETDAKRIRNVQDETLSIEKRHLAAEGLAKRRRDVAIAHIHEAFDRADVTGKEHIATLLEGLAKSLVTKPKAEVVLPKEATPHAATEAKKANRKAG